MAELDRNTIAKLCKLLPMLTSDQTGEVSATVAAMLRTLGSAGASVHDLVAYLNKPQKQRVVEKIVYRDKIVVEEKIVYRERPLEQVSGSDRCNFSSVGVADHCQVLLVLEDITQGERSFLNNMLIRAQLAGESLTMTPKQTIWFSDILSRYRDRMTVE